MTAERDHPGGSTSASTPPGRARIVVMASGDGSNFQAIVDAAASGRLAADVVGLVTDRPAAYAVQRATLSGIPVVVVAPDPGEDRQHYDVRLAESVAASSPTLVVLAGWMRLLSMGFLGRFPHRVVNIHPALPGEFPGSNAIQRALEAAQRLGLRRTGVMVHRVPDEGMDDGPVIAKREVEIDPADTVETLAVRIHGAEHELLIEALEILVAAGDT